MSSFYNCKVQKLQIGSSNVEDCSEIWIFRGVAEEWKITIAQREFLSSRSSVANGIYQQKLKI